MVLINQCQAQNEHFCGEVEVYFELRTLHLLASLYNTCDKIPVNKSASTKKRQEAGTIDH